MFYQAIPKIDKISGPPVYPTHPPDIQANHQELWSQIVADGAIVPNPMSEMKTMFLKQMQPCRSTRTVLQRGPSSVALAIQDKSLPQGARVSMQPPSHYQLRDSQMAQLAAAARAMWGNGNPSRTQEPNLEILWENLKNAPPPQGTIYVKAISIWTQEIENQSRMKK